MAESKSHRELKKWSSRWLREQGYLAVGIEVGDPTGRFRVDVAAWTDRGSGRSNMKPASPRSVLVECKQSRSDYFRDGASSPGLMARREQLINTLDSIGVETARLFPSASKDHGTLFDDMERSARRPDRDIRRIRVELTAVERRLYRGVKFAKLARWRGASSLLIAAPAGLLSPEELPIGWGLLEVPGRVLDGQVPDGIPATEVVRIRKMPPAHDVQEQFLIRLLRNIAIANSRFVGGRRVVAGTRSDFAGFPSTSLQPEPR